MHHSLMEFVFDFLHTVLCLSLGLAINALLKSTPFYKRVASGARDGGTHGRRMTCFLIYFFTTLAVVSLMPMLVWHVAFDGSMSMPVITFLFSGFWWYVLFEKNKLLSR